MICGVAASTRSSSFRHGLQGRDKDCPVLRGSRDIELTIIETRRPSDAGAGRGFRYSHRNRDYQAYLIFECICSGAQYSSAKKPPIQEKVIQYFTAIYRACKACIRPGDVMIGAGVLMARANGLSAKTFASKFIEMAVNNETTFTMGVGSIALGGRHPSGVWIPDSLTSHTNKIHVATLPYETKRLCQEIGGGIVETGCFPSYRDVTDPIYGKLVQKYVKAGSCSAEARARSARLTEWLTLGAGVPGCMHGGGSPDGASGGHSLLPLEKYAQMARKLAGIKKFKNPVNKKWNNE
jgi:4-hydroxybutyryl-CoA dehydratase/vinylacetyl-CoA-Delta-isomerase